MIKKKRGLGEGLITFPGGKVEGDETPLDCAIRETEEEVGVKITNPKKAGLIIFKQNGGNIQIMHVYTAREFTGSPKESDEAVPMWVSYDNLPFGNMWIDDRIWLPLVLQGKYVNCVFEFTNDWKFMISSSCEFT
ncbi:7,8-dihydro-8-oxoguanine triphosphatase [Acidianus sp. HS-5]|nr:7,8-dihydro-8-oxoguanine triphosphatase [Acidianus sp. HS-5]